MHRSLSYFVMHDRDLELLSFTTYESSPYHVPEKRVSRFNLLLFLPSLQDGDGRGVARDHERVPGGADVRPEGHQVQRQVRGLTRDIPSLARSFTTPPLCAQAG